MFQGRMTIGVYDPNRNNIKEIIDNIKREFNQEFGYLPSDEELAELMELPIEKIKELRIVEQNQSLLSLDQPIINKDGDQDTTIGDMQKDEGISVEEIVYRQELVKAIESMYDELLIRERLVMGNRFGTYEEFSSSEIEAMKLKYLLTKLLKKNNPVEELDRIKRRYISTNKTLNDMTRDETPNLDTSKIKTNKEKKEQLKSR